MTLKKAWNIKLIVQAILKTDGYRPISELRGFSLVAIQKAFKLIVAKQYHDLMGASILLERMGHGMASQSQIDFQKTVEVYDNAFVSLYTTLLPNAVFEEMKLYPKFSHEWAVAFSKGTDINESQDFKAMLKEETINGFASQFLTSLRADDPLFWQKVYTYLELPYQPCQGMKLAESM